MSQGASRRRLDDQVVVAILADAGWRYLSAPLWESEDVERSMERNLVVVPAAIRAKLLAHRARGRGE